MLEAIGALEAWDAPPALVEMLRSEVVPAQRSEMKAMGGLVDAALSAMCVYAHWIYGGERTQLVGEEEYGHVLLPAKRNEDEGRGDNASGLLGSGKALRVR